MNKPDIVPSSDWQLRKYRRFGLECPVRIRVQSADSFLEIETVSRNVSVGGLLVRSTSLIPQHAAVTFLMSLQAAKSVRSIRLVGEGEVVRVENSVGNADFLIAVRCDDPITQLEEYLAQA